MYNLYIYEKQLFESIKKNSEETYRKKFKLKRQKELNNLSQNYNNRIKNFISSMKGKSMNLRNNSSEDILSKTFNKKKFVFGEYKTEKKRLKEMESYKNELKSYEKEREIINKKRNILKIKNNRDFLLIQPEMKFTSKIKLKKNNIVNKKVLPKNELSDIPNLEKFKKNKYNKIKRIREFYNLIDKEYLNDSDIKEIIKEINDIEEDELNNQYTIKNYLAWKYYDDIIYKNFDKKEGKPKKKENKNDILESLDKKENENNIFFENNKFKTHFKGSSEYILMKESEVKKEEKKKIKKLEILKRNNIKNKNESSLDKEITLTLRLLNKEQAIRKEKLIQEKVKAETLREEKIRKENIEKNPFLIKKIFLQNKRNKNLNKNDYIFKDLNETCKRKKIKMNYLINKEMEKSITKQFMKKYNSMKFFDNVIFIEKENDLEDDNNFEKTKYDKEQKEKKILLVEQIIKEKRKLNDKKYYDFVKKFSKGIFGFKRKMNKKNLVELI